MEILTKTFSDKGFTVAFLKLYFYFIGDLTKTFDTINHELLIAKLQVYGSSLDALKVLLSYLQDRWQRVQINTAFSSWTQLLKGVPQGSVFGPMLFNIYINDIFFAWKGIDLCNFTDDTTLKGLETLEANSELAMAWFAMNYMKLNTDKCHLLVSRNKNRQIWAKLDREIDWEKNDVKLLRITLNNKLKFDKLVSNICSKANRKLSALARVAKFFPFTERLILFKAFTESQFKYCTLV